MRRPWSKRSLGSLVPKNRPIVYGIVQAGDHVPDGVPYIRSTDVTQNTPISALPRTSRKIARKYQRAMVMEGDLVFSLRGDIAAIRRVTADLAGANLTQGTARIAQSDQITTDFLMLCFTMPDVRKSILRVSKGSALREISLADLRKVKVPCPPIRLQIAIGMIARSYQRAFNSYARQIVFLRRRKKGLLRELLTGRRRFPEFQDEEWFVGHVGDVMKAAARPTEWNEDKTYRLASVRRRAGGIFEREHLRGEDIKVKSLFHLEKDDILLSHIQAAYGAIARVPEGFEDAYVSSTYSVLIPRDGRIDPVFAEYLFSSRWMWHQAYLASNGFFAERLRLCFNEADFLKRPISIPANVEEQRKIADVLTAADREIKLLGDLRDAIERQKRGLMQRLLTGEMTLPESMIEKLNAEAEAETALQQVGESS